MIRARKVPLLSTLARRTAPRGSTATQSVKVPPVSTHRRHGRIGGSGTPPAYAAGGLHGRRYSTAMPEDLTKALLVAAGGAIGALARYGVNGLAERLGPASFPLGTLLVNVTGCLMVGVLAYFMLDRPVLGAHQRLLLVTGFLGGLTTFSAFGYETFALARAGDWGWAGLNVAANVVLSLAAVWAGWGGARAIWH